MMAQASAGLKTTGSLAGRPDAFDPGDVIEFAVEHLLIKEEQRTEGLVLSRRGDVKIDVQVAEESGDLFFAHLLRVTFIVEEDEPANPINIGLFGADAVALDA